MHLPKDDPIIDVGGGESLLVDHLIDMGYSDLTVLDISQAALNKSQERLGSKAKLVQWIQADIITFQPKKEIYPLARSCRISFFNPKRRYCNLHQNGFYCGGSTSFDEYFF